MFEFGEGKKVQPMLKPLPFFPRAKPLNKVEPVLMPLTQQPLREPGRDYSLDNFNRLSHIREREASLFMQPRKMDFATAICESALTSRESPFNTRATNYNHSLIDFPMGLDRSGGHLRPPFERDLTPLRGTAIPESIKSMRGYLCDDGRGTSGAGDYDRESFYDATYFGSRTDRIQDLERSREHERHSYANMLGKRPCNTAAAGVDRFRSMDDDPSFFMQTLGPHHDNKRGRFEHDEFSGPRLRAMQRPHPFDEPFGLPGSSSERVYAPRPPQFDEAKCASNIPQAMYWDGESKDWLDRPSYVDSGEFAISRKVFYPLLKRAEEPPALRSLGGPFTMYSIANSCPPQTRAELEVRRHGDSLRKILDAAKNTDIWVETRSYGQSPLGIVPATTAQSTIYYYNAITLETTFEKPSSTRPDQIAYIVTQKDLQNVLCSMHPTTLIIKRMSKACSPEQITEYFSKFGKLAMVKVFEKNPALHGNSSRALSYFRMELLDAEKKILASDTHIINGHAVEVRFPHNRLFVARLPDLITLSELLEFFGNEAKLFNPPGYAVDAYFPKPFRQFAFVTLGGIGSAEKLSRRGDLLFKSRVYLNCSSLAIYDEDVDQLLSAKLRELEANRNIDKLNSLRIVAGTVRQVLKYICQTKHSQPGLWTIRAILQKLNAEIQKQDELSVRNYINVQDYILDLCVEVAHDMALVALRDEDQDPNLQPIDQLSPQPPANGARSSTMCVDDFTADIRSPDELQPCHMFEDPPTSVSASIIQQPQKPLQMTAEKQFFFDPPRTQPRAASVDGRAPPTQHTSGNAQYRE